jgi:hypothetical protein
MTAVVSPKLYCACLLRVAQSTHNQVSVGKLHWCLRPQTDMPIPPAHCCWPGRILSFASRSSCLCLVPFSRDADRWDSVDCFHCRTLDSTALHKACVGNHVECARLIIHFCNASLNVVDNQRWTPLMRAASKGHREVTRVLLEAKADTLLRNGDGLGM